MMEQTFDNNFIIIGATSGTICCHPLLIKVDQTGQNITGGPGWDMGRLYAGIEIANNELILTGFLYSPPILYIAKTNYDGYIYWDKTIFNPIGYFFNLSTEHLNDGSFILSGENVSPTSLIKIVKLDSVANYVWQKEYSFHRGKFRADNNEYFMAGQTTTSGGDIKLMRLNSLGDSISSVNYGGMNDEIFSNFQVTNDGGVIIIGSTESYGAGKKDVYIIKTNDAGLVTTLDDQLNLVSDFINIYPNSASDYLYFKSNNAMKSISVEILDYTLNTVYKNQDYTDSL